MKCPYCGSDMRPCRSIAYRAAPGVRLVEWVRCTRCEHATIVSVPREASRTARPGARGRQSLVANL
jgi:hypothetical protein